MLYATSRSTLRTVLHTRAAAAPFWHYSSHSLMKRKLDGVSAGSSSSSSNAKLGNKKMDNGAPAIELTPREQQLKALLLDVAAFVDRREDRRGVEPLVLRWAGGWVRDKLLGCASNDIDAALNSMTGFAFARQMQAFCDVPANTQRHGMGPHDLGNLHKVEANPDKSKHLETATVRIFDMEVDFVNLRRETYAADSRNPQVEFGTAEEDALRRDATVNALFYNLHTGAVEDFTGGLPDLAARRIKTPLAPLQTFTDDPLRVLRLVRFASRLQFAIDPDTEKYMAEARVLEALRRKISRERVGMEVEKMLKGKHPHDALSLIDRIGLYHAIFTDPAQPDHSQKPDLTGWRAAYDCLDYLATTKTPGSIYDVLVRTEEARYFAWVLAAVVPWEQVPEPDAGAASATKRPPPLAALSLREGIRAPNKLCDVVAGAHRHRREIAAFKQAVCDSAPYVRERDRFGMAVRAWEARGGNWRLQVLFALLFEVLEAARASSSSAFSAADRDTVLRGWQGFLDHLADLDVQDAAHIKRLLDGKQVAAALGIKPGKWMTAAMDICMAWQLRHPNETDPAGAIEEVRRRKDELGIGALLKQD
ncbi:tRNA nucleotidyltransferase [Niveomyces insectorum RCEF 264]|uniref:tRNA nucleotidyltransferase n=1 Tax=Niveomyces insectorum RCEF 264 TaxID=1081102 RepID=A0A168A7G6_9HYPO|nr:tRNA nucleotidyltransferase [Niveomyces insectorum RCEF 264]